MPPLLIGPVLRRVVDTRATVWVETGGAAEVTVRAAGGGLGRSATFSAYGHHYALVVVEGLTPDSSAEYEVFVDDVRVWPDPESPYPRSVIRTRKADDADQPVRLVFGSCRESTQHASTRRLPPDALDAYARRMMADGRDRPDLLMLLGDQVYADVISPKVRRLLKKRRKPGRGRPNLHRPEDQVVTYEEYTKLYLESWRDAEIRWLLATVPSVMIFDDHEIIDDWNTSASWRADATSKSWWTERITSGLASYWVYQHLGNLHPDEIATDPVYAQVRAAGDDATAVLRAFAGRVDKDADVAHDTPAWRAAQYQWSYALDVGRTRIVVLDNRCSRVLAPGQRAMLPPGEWGWFLDRAHGDYDHLVVGSSLPWLLPQGIHHLEAWSEKVIDTASPRRSAAGEKIRRAVDLEHWAAFQRSFGDMAMLFARIGSGKPVEVGDRVGAGEAYGAPASISVVSGDVHHSYVARVLFDADVTTPVHQLTCSPVHNQVPAVARPLMSLGWWKGPASMTRALARTAGLRRPVVRWRKLAGPYFGNAISTLRLAGRTAEVTIEGTTKDGGLRTVSRVPLARTGRAPREPEKTEGLAPTGSA
jgi:hypothetical protein